LIGKVRASLFRIILVSFILFFLVAHSGAESASGKGDLISKVVNAYGGKGLLLKVRAVSAEGRIKEYLSDDEGTYYRYMTRERKLLVDIRYSKTSEKRILDGRNGYRGTDGRMEKVIGPPFDAMVYQYNQLNLPYGLIDGSLKLIDSWKDTFNGNEVEVLKLEDAYGYGIEALVNPKDFLIQRVIGRFTAGNHQASLSAALTDFRRVNGILMPFKIINYAGDTRLSETLITSYKINPDVEESVFNP